MAIDYRPEADPAQIADWIAERLKTALAGFENAAITVPGGSTPFPVFEKLVALPLDWSRITIWPGDDRIVPEDHAASNTGRIRALFQPAGAKVQALREGAVPPPFALTWVGMGTDGHIASLFPNTGPLASDANAVRRLTPDPLPPEAPFDRLTLTIAGLVRTDAVMVMIRGAEKAKVFAAAAKGDSDTPVARFLAATQAPVTCFT